MPRRGIFFVTDVHLLASMYGDYNRKLGDGKGQEPLNLMITFTRCLGFSARFNRGTLIKCGLSDFRFTPPSARPDLACHGFSLGCSCCWSALSGAIVSFASLSICSKWLFGFDILPLFTGHLVSIGVPTPTSFSTFVVIHITMGSGTKFRVAIWSVLVLIFLTLCDPN